MFLSDLINMLYLTVLVFILETYRHDHFMLSCLVVWDGFVALTWLEQQLPFVSLIMGLFFLICDIWFGHICFCPILLLFLYYCSTISIYFELSVLTAWRSLYWFAVDVFICFYFEKCLVELPVIKYRTLSASHKKSFQDQSLVSTVWERCGTVFNPHGGI